MKVRFVAALVAVLAVAGCGGTSHKTVVPAVRVASVPAIVQPNHGCHVGDFAQGCAYPRPLYDSAGVTFQSNGIDFAWSCPDPGSYAFGASYLSPDGSKNWSRGCVNWWLSKGKSIVLVWESSADRAAQGYSAGRSDAQWAVQQAAALGQPSDRPIFFAIDYDAGGEVAPYFDGVRSVLPVSRIGAYGGIRPLAYLHDTGRIAYGWQAYAWSYSQWGFSALRQVQNGDAVDWDLALAADYGQWPYSAAPPPDPYRIFPKTRWNLPYGQKASEYNTARTWDQFGCANPVRRPTCKSTRYHLQLLRDRLGWVARHKRTAHGWVSLRKPDWARDRLGQRFHRIEYQLTH